MNPALEDDFSDDDSYYARTDDNDADQMAEWGFEAEQDRWMERGDAD